VHDLSDRQRQIIDAAIDLIAERSIQELTIKNLAGKIAVTDGAIYRHFKSKTDILLGILHSFQTQTEATVKQACASDLPALEQIENIFTKHFLYFTKRPAVAAVIFSESIFQNDGQLAREVVKLLEMHEKALDCVIDRGQKKGELRDDVPKRQQISLIIGAIRYTVTRWRLGGYLGDLNSEGKMMIEGIKKVLRK